MTIPHVELWRIVAAGRGFKAGFQTAVVIFCCLLCNNAAISAARRKTRDLSNSSAPPLTFVLVGDAGNRMDPATRTGKVDYLFEMSKYEVSNSQYCDFLNAVCAKDDRFGLYNVNMERGLFGGIRRVRRDGRYCYEPIDGWENIPVVYVSWYDAVRFCNWWHYGCPRRGEAALGTTEGDCTQGAYDTTALSSDARADTRTIRRKANARYWLPSLDEWRKAAYYDPTKDGLGSYWIYPVRSDVKPHAVAPGRDALAANYFDGHWAAPSPYLTPIGSYPQATSYYGTCDQGGNVWEWLETPRDAHRYVLGGAASNFAYALSRTHIDSEYPDHELYIFGFRIARAHTASQDKTIHRQ